MMDKNLLHFDGKILAVYFPPGLPERGGSCAFASMKCLVNCLSYLTQNDVTKATVNAFYESDAETLAKNLWRQIKAEPVKLMEWFCWGDCPPDLTGKIFDVIKRLSDKGVVQCGFTRNKKLWQAVLRIPNTRLGVTIEDMDEVPKYVREGLVAHPAYDTGETELFYKTTSVRTTRKFGSCGGSFMRDEVTQITYEADCQTCYKNKKGCFTKFKKIK